MNDYGFELYSDQPIPIEDGLDSDIFSLEHLREDLVSSLNESEMMHADSETSHRFQASYSQDTQAKTSPPNSWSIVPS